MQRDIRAYIFELRRFIRELQGFVDGKTPNEFLASSMLQRAVERDYEILAEIVKRMLAVTEETSARLPESRGIMDFRNLLAHQYDKVDEEKLWEITQVHLPVFKQQIEAWATELGMPPYEADPR